MRSHAAGLTRSRAVLWTLCGLASTAWAADGLPVAPSGGVPPGVPSPGAIGKFFEFDIPAQPLNAALNQYADISGQPALFPSDIVGGRVSTAVRGRYSAEAALRLLLQGTGLVSDKRSSGLGQTFVLKEVGPPPAAPGSGMAELFSEEGYPGLVQSRIWQALCANPSTRPGHYGSLLRFYLDADGRIRGARLIGTSGDARRDAALLDTLQRVHVDRAPPPAIVQHPLTMMVLPDGPDTGRQCSQGQGVG